MLYHLLYDFRIPIFFGAFWITGYAIYQSLYKIDEKKQKVSELKFVNKGSGYTVKTLPINVVWLYKINYDVYKYLFIIPSI